MTALLAEIPADYDKLPFGHPSDPDLPLSPWDQAKPATKERQGINPFTKEPTVFKAKPARNVVRVRPLKALKEMVYGAVRAGVNTTPRELFCRATAPPLFDVAAFDDAELRGLQSALGSPLDREWTVGKRLDLQLSPPCPQGDVGFVHSGRELHGDRPASCRNGRLGT